MLWTVNFLQTVAAGEWFTSLDLKDAYFHIPVFAFQGHAYQFVVLAFRLTLALNFCTMRTCIPPQLVDSILLLLLKQFQLNALVKAQTFQQLMGMLAVASAVTPLGLLSLRPLQVWLNDLHLDPKDRNTKTQVTREC